MMCFEHLDLETHRRKWSLVLNGLQGGGNESENMTRKKVRQFAKEKLKINDVESHFLAACYQKKTLLLQYVLLILMKEFMAKNAKILKHLV